MHQLQLISPEQQTFDRHTYRFKPLFSTLYSSLKTSNLAHGLTTSIRQIKSQIEAGAPIDKVANEFKLASRTCPSERWQAKAKDGAITISLSHAPNWTALGVKDKPPIDRFTYKINPKNLQAISPQNG